MALAYVLDALHRAPGPRVENFASFLERNPPQEEVGLVEPSSWSCVHGVERWRSNCGCKMAPERKSQQEWRTGLRGAMEWLASKFHETFEKEGRALLNDPWAARNAYVRALFEGHPGPPSILKALALPDLTEREGVRALELLEMERQALRLFTSCGWFFDDLAGIESLQVLGYAARGLELARPSTGEMEAEFSARLKKARSNEVPPRSGDTLFAEEVIPPTPAFLRVGAAQALWQSISPDQEADAGVPGFEARLLEIGRFEVAHKRTGRTWGVEAKVERLGAARLTVRVRPEGDTADFQVVPFDEMPSRYREAIRRVLLGQVLALEMREGRIQTVDAILADLPAILEQAMLDALSHLGKAFGEPEASPEGAAERIRDLAQIHGYFQLPIPFTVQTNFFRILETASSEAISWLSGLREPLGFVQQGKMA
jgi:hypothetical protein